MDIRKIEPAQVKMTDDRFKNEKREIAYKKKNFIFVKSYENFDLYKHKTLRI